MKKLLFTLLLAAGTLTAWAGDKYPNGSLYVAGDATTKNWGTNNNPSDCPQLYKVGDKKYEGFVQFDTTNGELKFLVTNAYEQGHWGPSSNQTSITSSTANLSYVSGSTPDNKFRFNLELGVYLVTVDLTTEGSESVTFKKWTSASDVYEIGCLNQLKAFADGVNVYDAAINGKLTADIGSSEGAKMDYAIGWYESDSKYKLYSGEFDGNGHTVYLGIDDTGNSKKGLFGAAKGNANIHDVIVAGSVKANSKVAGIIGFASGGGTITLNNVINKATIQSTGNKDANAAGLVGCAVSNTVVNASNCGNMGAVSGQDGECAAFAGWTQDSGGTKTTFTNCWNIAQISNIQSDYNLYRNTGCVTATNCYDASTTASRGQGTCLTVNGANNVSISNVTDLTNFSSIVNLGANFLNAELTDDIATYSGSYIGNEATHKYIGTFDGKTHKITINFNKPTESQIGLFKHIDSGCTIQNLIVDGTINGNQFMGGLVNLTYGNPIIQNVIVGVNMTSSYDGDGTHGGVISVAQSGSAPTIRNVAFVGSINAEDSYSSCGIIGYAHSGGSITYRNCYVTGTLTLDYENESDRSRVFGRNGEYCVNCYTTLDKKTLNNEERFDGGTVTTDQVASGELCYLINGSSCYGAKWFQTNPGTVDTYPVPFNTHGIVNKISSVGYTTQFIGNTDVTIPAGVKAYAGVINGNWLSLREIEGAIFKNDAVILKGSEGYYSFVPTTGASEAASNALLGSDGDVTGDGTNYYALSTLGGTEPIGFYLVNSGVTIPAGKAYLNTSTGVKGFTFVFDDDATGIESLTPALSEGEGAIYNVAGQRVSRMQKGINIINGKKVLY